MLGRKVQFLTKISDFVKLLESSLKIHFGTLGMSWGLRNHFQSQKTLKMAKNSLFWSFFLICGFFRGRRNFYRSMIFFLSEICWTHIWKFSFEFCQLDKNWRKYLRNRYPPPWNRVSGGIQPYLTLKRDPSQHECWMYGGHIVWFSAFLKNYHWIFMWILWDYSR